MVPPLHPIWSSISLYWYEPLLTVCVVLMTLHQRQFCCDNADLLDRARISTAPDSTTDSADGAGDVADGFDGTDTGGSDTLATKTGGHGGGKRKWPPQGQSFWDAATLSFNEKDEKWGMDVHSSGWSS